MFILIIKIGLLKLEKDHIKFVISGNYQNNQMKSRCDISVIYYHQHNFFAIYHLIF